MFIAGELLQIAQDCFKRAINRANALRIEYLETQNRLADLKTKLDLENLAEDRLANFQVKIGGDYQCPPLLDRE
jgi:hypothetical protein